jgi:hypothetical protein
MRQDNVKKNGWAETTEGGLATLTYWRNYSVYRVLNGVERLGFVGNTSTVGEEIVPKGFLVGNSTAEDR